MHITTAILVLHSTLCLTIKVPVTWNNDSEVKPVTQDNPNPYFHYAANKPQFAIDVAKFHDVKSPEKHYESYPLNPHTGVKRPEFGNRQILDSAHKNFKPYQGYVKEEHLHYVNPHSNYYEVHHPYRAEVPALQGIYKDPVLHKIRNDVRDSKNRLQKYEHDAGEPNVEKDEYLEGPEQIDRKKIPHPNIPAHFEVHRPLRRPIYYQKVPQNSNRESFLNQKLRHPWNQNYAKVTPHHYHPLKHHLHQLRQHHALTYDDERNEYPQVLPPERYAEKPDGYDIYEKGKNRYQQIKNTFDETANRDSIRTRPDGHDHLELQKENHESSTDPEYEEEVFVPIKNYAQVRKTETYKHLPKSAAFKDAQSLEEIQNAPRLREAIKSSKNQVVYSEEGYEDSAYDHAGEQKHASDHEGHGGALKENEESRGKYKIPSVDIGFADEGKSTSRDKVLHGEKWNDEQIDVHEENDSDDYSENENDYSNKENLEDPDELNERNKRESKFTKNENLLDHEVTKRDAYENSSTPLAKDALRETSSNKTSDKYIEKLRNKYPYYLKNSKTLNKDSPLRYSENLKLIPKKRLDNSAFYNSRMALECPDVETEVNPVPAKFKNDEVSKDTDDDDYDNGEGGEEEFKNFKNKQRLKGLGDKIDCLKTKYFGEDPLDSPFFKEESIQNPLPVVKPNSDFFSVNKFKKANDVKNNYRDNSNSRKKPNDNHSFPNTHILQYTSPVKDVKNMSNNYENKNRNISQTAFNNQHGNNQTRLSAKKRKRRAATFMYEPYKVIKESQNPDSKRLATSSNVSPLIRKLQTRQAIDKTIVNNEKVYKDIGKNDRPSRAQEDDFIDVSTDSRRGEPRYELGLKNHRSQYSPVENRTSISAADYKIKIENGVDVNQHKSNSTIPRDKKTRKLLNVATTNKPYFDVSKYLPQTLPTQNIAASNTVPKIARSKTSQKEQEEVVDEDDYEEYDDEDEEEDILITTTTTTSTTTQKPVVRKRIRLAPTTTTKPNSMKLQLVTRFHTSTTDTPIETTEHRSPKYREKKKKTSKSTLVTDTESYGDDGDDMKQEEIDAMIGVKQDMDDYTPSYEKEQETKIRRNNKHNSKSNEDIGDDEDEDEDDDDDDDIEEEDEEDVDEVEEDDEEDDNDDTSKDSSDKRHNKDSNREEPVKNNEQANTQRHEKKFESKGITRSKSHRNSDETQPTLEITTSEPTKRTLVRTTEPTSTTEVLHSDLQPKITKKKLEIHKELPVNKTSPHLTHFKQDIKEIEIIKELDEPKGTDRTNSISLHLYKDENLAKEINNLGDIEIFKEDLDLESGPRHGGNYRSIENETLDTEMSSSSDVDTSETETKKVIELETSTNRPKLRSDIIRSKNLRNRNAKQSESNNDKQKTVTPSTRERNAKLRQTRTRNNERSAKLIELQDDENDDDTDSMHGGNLKSHNTYNNRPMHGGNYRSAKLTRAKNIQEISTEPSSTRSGLKRNRKIEAELLNAYANAVPIITSTPAFILDPSKRMYYYVEK